EVRASSGESFLGGEDCTRALCARLLESRNLLFERAELDTPLLVSRLMRECELAKCALSTDQLVSVRFPDKNGQLQPDGPVLSGRGEQLDLWCERTIGRMELPIRRALGDARIRPADLQEVILVGGATRMPMVRQRVEQMFEKPPSCRLNPDEVVALG